MTLRPWREVFASHPDVLEGTSQQSEFAAGNREHIKRAVSENATQFGFFGPRTGRDLNFGSWSELHISLTQTISSTLAVLNGLQSPIPTGI